MTASRRHEVKNLQSDAMKRRMCRPSPDRNMMGRDKEYERGKELIKKGREGKCNEKEVEDDW